MLCKKKHKYNKIIFCTKCSETVRKLARKLFISERYIFLLSIKALIVKRIGAGGRQFDQPCRFSKNVSSNERLKPWFFVTFSIISRNILPKNFIEFCQFVQKI